MTPWRDDIVTTSTCPVCGTGFDRVRRQRYCSAACKQSAFRQRQQPTAVETSPAPAKRRRHYTVYECGDCEQRYAGQQWCHDCNRPCTRIGQGGPCPNCDEPLTIDDLLPAPPR